MVGKSGGTTSGHPGQPPHHPNFPPVFSIIVGAALRTPEASRRRGCPVSVSPVAIDSAPTPTQQVARVRRGAWWLVRGFHPHFSISSGRLLSGSEVSYCSSASAGGHGGPRNIHHQQLHLRQAPRCCQAGEVVGRVGAGDPSSPSSSPADASCHGACCTHGGSTYLPRCYSPPKALRLARRWAWPQTSAR